MTSPRIPDFGDLAAKLGINPATVGQGARSNGEAYMPHREFAERKVAENVATYESDVECGGTLRVDDRTTAFVVAVCDVCGFEVAVKCGRGPGWALERANLPTRFVDKPFEPTSESANARKAIQTWLAQLDSGLLPAPAIFGPLGTGKTHLLVRACRQLALSGHRVLFLSVAEWLTELQRSFENRAEHERVWLRAVNAPVLALDDLGAEGATDWRADTVAELVDRRERAEGAVLLTTNVRPERWGEAFDPRTASRLRGLTFGVELGGPDRRRGVAAPATLEVV